MRNSEERPTFSSSRESIDKSSSTSARSARIFSLIAKRDSPKSCLSFSISSNVRLTSGSTGPISTEVFADVPNTAEVCDPSLRLISCPPSASLSSITMYSNGAWEVSLEGPASGGIGVGVSLYSSAEGRASPGAKQSSATVLCIFAISSQYASFATLNQPFLRENRRTNKYLASSVGEHTREEVSSAYDRQRVKYRGHTYSSFRQSEQ